MLRWSLFIFFFSFIHCFLESEHSKIFLLKEDYKNFFKKPVNYQYISNDIELHSNLFPTVKGKEQYKFILNSLQFFSKKVFLYHHIDVFFTKETSSDVELSWKLKGQTKILYPVSIEGYSNYEKNSTGYLTKHNITLFIKPSPIPLCYNILVTLLYSYTCI